MTVPHFAPAVVASTASAAFARRSDALHSADASILLRTPVHRQSVGSPLVARGAVVGLIASPDAAWTARAVAAAAARAVRVGVDRAAAGV